MAILPDLALFTRVNRAIQQAPVGSKVTRGIADLADALKNGFRFRFWRNNVLSLDVIFSSGPLISGNTVVISAARIASIATILDTATNSGTLRAQVQTSDGYLIRGNAGRSGADYAFTGDIVAANGLTGLSIVFSLPISLDAGAAGSYNAQSIVDDMYQPNDFGYTMPLYPNAIDRDQPGGHYAYVNCQLKPGTPNFNGGYQGSTGTLSQSYAAYSNIRIQPWGWIGQCEDVWPTSNPRPRGNPSPNTRALLRNFRQYELLTNGQWVRRTSASMSGAPVGAWYQTSGFDGLIKSAQAGSTYAWQVRDESATGGGQSIGHIGYGTTPSNDDNGNPAYVPASTPKRAGQRSLDYRDWNYHWFPAGYTRYAQDMITQTQGTWATFEVFLVLHDPNGVDDRDGCDLGVLCAQDYYAQDSDGIYRYMTEAYHSRVRRLTKTPQIMSCTDIPSAVILANPPPFTF